jgi:enoyl-CoA hydratase
MAFETIVTETRGRVALITLNRPTALNALNATLIGELGDAVAAYDADQRVGCIVITGSEKAFAAGADIKEMRGLTFVEAFQRDYGEALAKVARARKPIIAAVAGYCLGGGSELAMICDIVIAADTAKFGQPEITLGIMPGMGPWVAKPTRASAGGRSCAKCSTNALTGIVMKPSLSTIGLASAGGGLRPEADVCPGRKQAFISLLRVYPMSPLTHPLEYQVQPVEGRRCIFRS